MATPQLSPEQIDELSQAVAEYIATQRGRFLSRSAKLSNAQMAAVGGFFRADLLEATQVVVLENERIGNPDFYPMLASMGFSNLPDINHMDAITLRDVVAFHVPLTIGTLFHELVHVEQYRQLGLRRFSEFYVRGFLSGGGYYGIPLEINAYELGARFEGHPDRTFSVENEVASWVRDGRF
jgi:hypothetical protein